MNLSLIGYYILDYAILSIITIKYSYQINFENPGYMQCYPETLKS